MFDLNTSDTQRCSKIHDILVRSKLDVQEFEEAVRNTYLKELPFSVSLGLAIAFQQKYMELHVFTMNRDDLKQLRNKVIHNLSFPLNHQDENQKAIALSLLHVLTLASKDTLLRDIEQLKEISSTRNNPVEVVKTGYFIISLCCCTTLDYESLIHSCNSILNDSSPTLCPNDFLYIALVLYEVGWKRKNFPFLRDAFIIISNTLLVTPLLENERMIGAVGNKLFEMYSDLHHAEGYLEFLEFVGRRITTSCNNIGLKKFAEELKCVLKQPFEEDLMRFEKGEQQCIYKALHSVYNDNSAKSYFTRGYKLSKIDRTALEQGFELDFNERLILLCNCIHNFHDILTRNVMDNLSFTKGCRILESHLIFNVEAYDYAITNFIELILHPSNPSPTCMNNFNERFFVLFISLVSTRYKEIKQAVEKKVKDIEETSDIDNKERMKQAMTKLLEFIEEKTMELNKCREDLAYYKNLKGDKPMMDRSLYGWYMLSKRKEITQVDDPYEWSCDDASSDDDDEN
ncbi:hypothetical protein C9374_001551 [Naegleria lovaniensis]|uniref:Uncharacterized protein n=1 Tax=Naegleria lovaniensis TaxID=51637 RepID=A0AA88KMR9_NAELO|nr:uncharacterized protein C9374_001551 [Naegleria lovaniensis]KAG2387219.1 hypothetical protein C9374_001551 [Naegleria lovaniensis]